MSNSEVKEQYQRAQIFIEGYGTQALVQNDNVFPVWVEGTNCFWYERAYKREAQALDTATRSPSAQAIAREYRLVDAKASSSQAAFDHGTFAEALSEAACQMVDAEDLPISYVALSLTPLQVCFNAFDKRWQFDGEQGTCREIPSDILPVTEVLSPDGKQIAFIRDYNLWTRDVATGKERALTHDGEDDYIYYAASTAWGTTLRRATTPAALWSPDSTRLLTVKRDKRQVKTLPMSDYVPKEGSIRPQLSLTKVAYPGDEHIETWRPLMVEVATGTICEADYSPIPSGFSDYAQFFNNLLWWAADSRKAYFIDQTRGDQVVRLLEFDTHCGSTRVVFEEVSETHINILPDTYTCSQHCFLPDTNELIWWSERSGWGHLYLYDLTSGQLKHAITAGDWRVRDVVHVDKAGRELWLHTSARTSGRDPYYRDICRVNIDTGEINVVLSTDEETTVHYPNSTPVFAANMKARSRQQVSGVSPHSDYVVVTRSRADRAPVTVLMDRVGNQLLELETADTSALPEEWQWPEPFNVLAADGKTELYGLMFRPSDFSPDKRYPVLNYVFNAPWLSIVPKGSFHNWGGYVRHYFHGAALAELGFIVIFIDTRGTAARSKAFLDESYGWIPGSTSKGDHIGSLQQLAARYPFMDMDRVGVFGHGYRSGLQHFLECQDTYKVCVQMSVLDSRMIGAFEQEMWEGCEGPSDDRRYPEQLVDNLEGKLLLMHAMTSMLSPAYPPAAVFRVIDALQNANKDFDMLLLPDGGVMCNSYMYRRAFDYLIKHLQRREPPKEFDLGHINM